MKATDYARTIRFKRSAGRIAPNRGVSGLDVLFRKATVSVWFLCAGVMLTSIHGALADTRIYRLRCEYLEDPLGIDSVNPRLSWNLASVTPGVRGLAQSAYQILVASSPDKLANDEGELWDSGRVSSDESVLIPYAGKPLASRSECFWKVRVWDQNGSATAWSPPARWTMGLSTPDDWNAQWIGLDGEEPAAEAIQLEGAHWVWYPEGTASTAYPLGSRYFRRTFQIPDDRNVKCAYYRAAVDDHCTVFLNGRRICSHDNFRTVRESDVTGVRPDVNVLGIIGINGGDAPNSAGVLGVLIVEFDDGSQRNISTDAQWKSSDKDEPGWNTDPDLDESRWKPVEVIGSAGVQPWGTLVATENRRLPARFLRKEFTSDKKVRRATVSYSGLGLSELYLNGEKVGDEVLSPGLTEYPKRTIYVTHDVTNQIQNGENAIGVILGNGRYHSVRGEAESGMLNYGFPKLLLNLHIDYIDGSQQDVVSDTSWKLTAEGPIIANNEFDGEEYDARKEFSDWTRLGFNDSMWLAAELVDAPKGELSAQMADPIRVIEPVRPVEVTEPQPGTFVFDMGQNIVGWCRLKVKGPAGTTIKLRHAETVDSDGSLYVANLRGAAATDIYTLKGGKLEIWEPRFTYHGFRFVEVTGFPGKPTLDTLTGQVVHDDLEFVGQFSCSNQLINKIYNNIVWGVRGNYRSIPTDCPQRDERLGWLGDRSEESKGESYLFDIAALYTKWLRDIEDSQKANGSIPDLCPAHLPLYSDNVTWPSAAVIIPDMLHRQYGDKEVVARQYGCAKKWVDHMLEFVQDGIIDRDSYGDWCVPPEDPALIHSKDPARTTDKALLATAFLYHDLQLMQEFATILGKKDDAQRFATRAQELATAFNNRFLKSDLEQYDNGTQTANILPLYFGLVPEEKRQAIFQGLVDNIVDKSHGHIGTGVIGGKYLNQVLSSGGRADVAYTIASQSDYPSWGYMISQGATTVWELWNGNTADPSMNSHNHVMLVGDLVVWFFEYLAGIAPDDANPGFKHIVMRPHPVGDLSFARASFRSPYGPVRSEWQRSESNFDWTVLVPANTTATLYVPTKDANAVTESGQNAKTADGVSFVGMDNDRAIFEVTSGSYNFQSEYQPGSLERAAP